jgi:two-component system chemotaxis response regulator CheY
MAAPAQAQPLTSRKLKLMICDDSNIIRRKIERELQIDRLQVIATASNGRQAVEAFRKEPADVVTMDITMPEISALSDKATAIEALKKGANGFLCKPFTDRQLTEALEELLRGAGNDD